MTSEMWFDIAVCVLCSVFGGLIVGTFSEFVPMRPSFVRKSVMVVVWLLLIGGAFLMVMGYYWGGDGILGGAIALVVLGVLFAAVITSSQEAEGKRGRGE